MKDREQKQGFTLGRLDLWLVQRQRLVLDWQGPVLLVAPKEYGVEHLLSGLKTRTNPTYPQTERVLWVELGHLNREEEMVGVFAGILSKVTGVAMVPASASMEQVLQILRHHLALLERYTLVVRATEAILKWVEPLLGLYPLLGVIIAVDNLDPVKVPQGLNLPENTLVFTPDELSLDHQEAKALVGGWLGDFEVHHLLDKSQKALEVFLATAQDQLGKPLPMPDAFPEEIDPLIENGQWLEALEQTCRQFPDGVPWLLAHIGPQLEIVGRWEAMSTLFSSLPRKVRQCERVLQWRLECAIELGQSPKLLREVESYLLEHEAPDLRALYGHLKYKLGDLQSALQETERAAKVWDSVRTLHYYGSALYLKDLKAGKQALLLALQMAEHQGDYYWAAKSSSVLARCLLLSGDYRGAASWAEWSVRAIDREGIHNPAMRVRAVCHWVFARMMLGETAGSEARLKEAISQGPIEPRTTHYLYATLAHFLLAEGRPAEALPLYRHLWDNQVTRDDVPMNADRLVRCLVELGQLDEAQTIAEQGIKLSEQSSTVYGRLAKLAMGTVLALQSPSKATPWLEGARKELSEPMIAWRYMQAGLYLARAHQTLGDLPTAQRVIGDLQAFTSTLGTTGLRFLSGPAPLFHSIWGWIRGSSPRLELVFLRSPEVRLDGELLSLSGENVELLALLALNPQGLSLEQLSVALSGNHAKSYDVQTNLNLLRRHLPIDDAHRLEVSLWADFLEVPKLLGQGNLREAVGWAKETFLPDSQAEPLVQYRHQLEELLRQAVLSQDDLEARLVLAERTQNDLELWQASLMVMPAHDPRRLSTTTKIENLVEQD